ncbi:MAG: hypothetical protein JO086_00105 [Acidimicrobiia bacterium]|nr:hypothetical protein [Acidimicrobiia bacterium]
MPSLKGRYDPRAIIDEAAAAAAARVESAVAQAKEDAAEIAAAMPSVPERATDLLERATVACSATFSVPDPWGRSALYSLELMSSGQQLVRMMDVREPIKLPGGNYRALVFILPVST